MHEKELTPSPARPLSNWEAFVRAIEAVADEHHRSRESAEHELDLSAPLQREAEALQPQPESRSDAVRLRPTHRA
jgi:hypothetical protein